LEGVNEIIILQRDSRYEVGDPDCVFKVKSGDLITPIKRIGYKTTFDDWEDYGEITDEDIKDLYIFCCPNDEIQTEVYISICSNWDLIFVGRYKGIFFDNTEAITAKINAWINNNMEV
jgi:hypothetical protein